MEARVDSWGEADTVARVVFWFSGDDKTYDEYLDDGNRLYLEGGGDRTRMREVPETKWLHEGDQLITWLYEAESSEWERGARFDLVHEHDDYEGSRRASGTLPTPFEITSGPEGEVSRSEDDIVVTWEPVEDYLAEYVFMTVFDDWDDRCMGGTIEGSTDGSLDSLDDDGEYTIPAGSLRSDPPVESCPAALRLYRCREGDTDFTVDEEDDWVLCQARRLDFVTTP